MREHTELVYILLNSRKRHCIFFQTDYIQRHFLLTLGRLEIIQIFSIHVNLEFRYFTGESILSWFIFPKTEQNKALYTFSNRIYPEPFSFNFEVPRYYLDFFNSRKFKISVFYMREHIELVYILHNRVAKRIL